jgi:dihydrofolate reductase
VSFDVVVAADLDWGIGKDQSLPWPKLRGDLRHFKRITSTASEGRRNAIVMGRKTWESKEVGGQPLPNRLNVVVARSLDEALALPDVETIFVVGGAGVLVDAVERRDLRNVYLTRIDGHYECEIQMPDLDARGFTRVAWDGEQSGEEHGVRYRIECLRRT